jgi:hypothetical protein
MKEPVIIEYFQYWDRISAASLNNLICGSEKPSKRKIPSVQTKSCGVGRDASG